MLFKNFKAHRNPDYLNWLRLHPCLVSLHPAEVVHHVRLGTNGGMGMKPSDYFCIPLLNCYHTTGPDAVHRIGEMSFFEKFQINIETSFYFYLKAYLKRIDPDFEQEVSCDMIGLNLLIDAIEKKKSPPLVQKKRTLYRTKPLQNSLRLKRKKKAKKKKLNFPFKRQINRL